MPLLITGANGQIGTALARLLRSTLGAEEVICSDIRKPVADDGPFVLLDVTDQQKLEKVIRQYDVDEIYHLAAILSAKGEETPQKTWQVNLNGLLNILESSRIHNISKVFFPSSIAVHGPITPKRNTPQESPLLPETVYGMSKLAGENWCHYYFHRYGLDVRSVRFPGIISHEEMPGGGITDYAVEIFHAALEEEKYYTCFLRRNTLLPFLYMPDALDAMVKLMSASPEELNVTYSYNLTGVSFTPGDLANEIRKTIPNFKVDYKPDFRQEIADSWARTIDDSAAREDWGWQHQYGLTEICSDMLTNLSKKLKPITIANSKST